MQTDVVMMVEAIDIMIAEMSNIFDQVGLKRDMFDFCTQQEQTKKFPIEIIKEAHAWCCELRKIYEEILDVKKLLTEDMWRRYQLWGGFEEHRESMLLQQRLEKFKKILVCKMKYPSYFKKGTFNAESRKLHAKSSKHNSRSKTAKKA